MRRLIWIVAALAMLLACHTGGVSRTNSTEAGAPAQEPARSQSVDMPPPGTPEWQRLAPLRARRALNAKAAEAHRKAAAAYEPDPRVAACTREAWDKASLLECLRGFEAPRELDGGRAYSVALGASPPNVPPYKTTWLVPAWFVNPSTGSDNNTCVDSGHQCQHVREIIARWETGSPQLPQATKLSQTADQTDTTDTIAITPLLLQGGSFTYEGAQTTNASGTLGTVTALSRFRTPEPRLQVDLGAAAAGSLNLMVVNTTRQSAAWVVALNGTIATMTQPVAVNVTAYAQYPTRDDGWTTGNAFNVVQFTKGFCSRIDASANANAVNDSAIGAVVQTFVGHMWCANTGPGQTLGASQLFTSAQVRFTESRIDQYVNMALIAGDEGNFVNTNATQGGVFQNVSVQAGVVQNLSVFSSNFAGIIEEDAQLLAIGGFNQNPLFGQTILGQVYIGADNLVTGITDLFGDQSDNPILYGPGTVDWLDSNSSLLYSGGFTAAQQFSPALTFSPNHATACDLTLTPSPCIPARALTVAALDLAVNAGGFGSHAKFDNGGVLSNASQATAAPSQWLNAGTGISITQNSPGAGQVTIANTSPASLGVPQTGSTVTLTAAQPWAIISPGGTYTLPASPVTGEVFWLTPSGNGDGYSANPATFVGNGNSIIDPQTWTSATTATGRTDKINYKFAFDGTLYRWVE